MFKFIILLALIGVGGYFLFQKMEADKAAGAQGIATMEVNKDSSAAAKIIKNIANDDKRYEGF